jgi:hypothetical protein
VPRDLETICLMCLRKDPRRRYRSAAELADDLACFMGRRPIKARPIGLPERTILWARRRPGVAALLALLVCLAGTAIAVTTWLWQKERIAANQAVQETDKTRKALLLAEEEARLKEEARRQTAEEARLKGEAYWQVLEEWTKAVEAEQRYQTVLNRRTLDLAYQAWLRGDVAQARELLRQCPRLQRGFEWRILHWLCHADVPTFTLGALVELVRCSPDDTRSAVARDYWLHAFRLFELLRILDGRLPA